MSDKALIQGAGSVMVRDWPHLFHFTHFYLKGCQQLLLMPGGGVDCLPPLHGGVEGGTEVFLLHLGCCWFGMCYLGGKLGGLLSYCSALGSCRSFPGRELSPLVFLQCERRRECVRACVYVCMYEVAGRGRMESDP